MDSQQHCIMLCVDWLVPPVILRIFIAMILYDLQMDTGGGARNGLTEEFVRRAYEKSGLKKFATELLVEVLVRCTHHRYDVLEVFSVAEVFMRNTVRPCYMSELLMDMKMGQYRLHVEKWLRAEDLRVTGKISNQRVVHLR